MLLTSSLPNLLITLQRDQLLNRCSWESKREFIVSELKRPTLSLSRVIWRSELEEVTFRCTSSRTNTFQLNLRSLEDNFGDTQLDKIPRWTQATNRREPHQRESILPKEEGHPQTRENQPRLDRAFQSEASPTKASTEIEVGYPWREQIHI